MVDRVGITKAEEDFFLLEKGVRSGIEKIEQIPDNVEEIKNNSIAKPLLEFVKQRNLLKQILLQNLNYLKPTVDEFNSLLEIDYNKDLDIVKVTRRLMELYDRITICLNQAEETAERTLVEIYSILRKERKM